MAFYDDLNVDFEQVGLKAEDEESQIVLAKELIKYIEDMYPDEMVDHDATAWERGRLYGKVELIKEMKQIVG
jgi:hypothetical protein